MGRFWKWVAKNILPFIVEAVVEKAKEKVNKQ